MIIMFEDMIYKIKKKEVIFSLGQFIKWITENTYGGRIMILKGLLSYVKII